MESRSRVKAYLLLLIMVLLSLHDLIPHIHHSDFGVTNHFASGHTHAHDHEHLDGNKQQDPDLPKSDKERTFLDFLFGQHLQVSHVPQISLAGYQIIRPVFFAVNAVLPETFQFFCQEEILLTPLFSF